MDPTMTTPDMFMELTATQLELRKRPTNINDLIQISWTQAMLHCSVGDYFNKCRFNWYTWPFFKAVSFNLHSKFYKSSFIPGIWISFFQ